MTPNEFRAYNARGFSVVRTAPSRRRLLAGVLILLGMAALMIIVGIAASKPTSKPFPPDDPEEESSEKPDENELVCDLPVIAEKMIEHVSPKFPVFPFRDDTRRRMKEDRVRDVLQAESWALNDFIKSLDKPLFETVPGSMGIVMTCKLNQLCLVNIAYMLDQLKVDVPVEVWLNKKDMSLRVVDSMKKRWQDRLIVKCFDDIEERYIDFFGPVIQVFDKYFAPYRFVPFNHFTSTLSLMFIFHFLFFILFFGVCGRFQGVEFGCIGI